VRATLLAALLAAGVAWFGRLLRRAWRGRRQLQRKEPS
jgi:hypothetical protein